MNTVWFCASVLTFFCAIDIGTSLKCHNCMIVEGYMEGHPCQNLVQCLGSFVCMSTKITVQSENEIGSFIYKTCFPKLDGNECWDLGKVTRFLLSQVSHFKIYSANDCYTCEIDGCNGSESRLYKAPLTLLLSLSLFSLLWCA